MFYLAIVNDFVVGYLAGGLIGFLTLIEFVAYGRTTLTLNEEELKINRTAFFGTEMDNYTIPLKEIRSVDYEVKVYDTYYLIFHFFLEVMFPADQSILTILLLDGSKKEVIFNGHQQQLRKFLKELPDRSPNGYWE
jgi:hypothetical protein